MSNDMELDDSDHRVLRDVDEHGWHAVVINDQEPSPFVFGVGVMHTLDHPDLIMFGLDVTLMHGLLWGVYREIARGRRFDGDCLYDGVLEGFAIATRRAHPSWHPHYLGYAQWHRRYLHARGTLQAVQLVWPDKAGLFPWDDGCHSSVVALQPRLDQPKPEEAGDA